MINRELSWLEFNDRVLRQGCSDDVSLSERLKFLAIVSSNLDEFFMIRVAGLKQQYESGIRSSDPSGMSPKEQLHAISIRTHELVARQYEAIRNAAGEMQSLGVPFISRANWSSEHRSQLETWFDYELESLLTPLAISSLEPCPLLPGLQLNVALLIEQTDKDGNPELQIASVPVPTSLPRIKSVGRGKSSGFVPIEEVIAAFASRLFRRGRVLATTVFRITRDADVAVAGDDAADLMATMEEAIINRKRRSAVRLEISSDADPEIRRWLIKWLGLTTEDVYDIDGPIDATALFDLVADPRIQTPEPAWLPQVPQDLHGSDSIWSVIQDHDVMLFHPYESFEPVVRLVNEAADDPNVLAIKQILYRTSGDSPIVEALERAADSGKEVTVLVELKARFDESRNIRWARRLEDAGAHVIYGLAGLKTHAKALLIVRREGAKITRYAHLATGNYNDRTARIYSDVGLMTTDRRLTLDVAAMFNLLTGDSEPVGWNELSIAPTSLRDRVIEMIDRERQLSTPEQPGEILAKINSLEDPEVIDALYRASLSGVKIKLNVRGICCLRPGVEGLSENIEVISIVDRYLEHARIFYFAGGGSGDTFISSADWMRRNLDKRLEMLVPIRDSRCRQRLLEILQTYFADNVKAMALQPDGTYEPVKSGKKKSRVRAQETLYNEAVAAAQAMESGQPTFRPITKSE